MSTPPEKLSPPPYEESEKPVVVVEKPLSEEEKVKQETYRRYKDFLSEEPFIDKIHERWLARIKEGKDKQDFDDYFESFASEQFGKAEVSLSFLKAFENKDPNKKKKYFGERAPNSKPRPAITAPPKSAASVKSESSSKSSDSSVSGLRALFKSWGFSSKKN